MVWWHGVAMAAAMAWSCGAAGADEFGVLYPAPGAEATWYACTACHSEMLIAQQGMTRERWASLLVRMVDEMGMAELPPEDEHAILDYLAEHYGPDRPHFRR